MFWKHKKQQQPNSDDRVDQDGHLIDQSSETHVLLRATPTWEVRWHGGHTNEYDRTEFQEHVEVFVDEEHANLFANALREAFSLLRISGKNSKPRIIKTEPISVKVKNK